MTAEECAKMYSFKRALSGVQRKLGIYDFDVKENVTSKRTS